MSIPSQNSRNDYTGNGVTTAFPYVFKIFKKQDLKVTTRNLSNVEFTLTLDIDYTVSGVKNPSGGSITLLAGALATGHKLTIRRVVELKQETDVRNQGDFLPEVHEDQFDRHTMADQQLKDEVDRSIKNPETVPTADFNPILPANIQTPNRALVTNATGTGFALGLTSVDATRIFNSDTYAALKAQAIADPTALRWGWATDIKALVFYTADLSVGDQGWIVVGG